MNENKLPSFTTHKSVFEDVHAYVDFHDFKLSVYQPMLDLIETMENPSVRLDLLTRMERNTDNLIEAQGWVWWRQRMYELKLAALNEINDLTN